jgi:hypothetical protein
MADRIVFDVGGEVPRLVAVEGEVGEDGRYSVSFRLRACMNTSSFLYSFPIYRHPADESPPLSAFSPTVSLIREHVQKVHLDTFLM